MDLFKEEEKAKGSSAHKEIHEDMSKEEIAYIKKQKKKVKVCDVPEEHVRRRTQWTTLRGNPWRSLAWTDESSEEETELDEKKEERKKKKAERKAEQKVENNTNTTNA